MGAEEGAPAAVRAQDLRARDQVLGIRLKALDSESKAVRRLAYLLVDNIELKREATNRHLMEVFPGITMDPDVRFGKPCIAGTRMDVATVVGLFAAGETMDTVTTEYALSRDQVRAALAYVAHVASHLPPAVKQAS